MPGFRQGDSPGTHEWPEQNIPSKACPRTRPLVRALPAVTAPPILHLPLLHQLPPASVRLLHLLRICLCSSESLVHLRSWELNSTGSASERGRLCRSASRKWTAVQLQKVLHAAWHAWQGSPPARPSLAWAPSTTVPPLTTRCISVISSCARCIACICSAQRSSNVDTPLRTALSEPLKSSNRQGVAAAQGGAASCLQRILPPSTGAAGRRRPAGEAIAMQLMKNAQLESGALRQALLRTQGF